MGPPGCSQASFLPHESDPHGHSSGRLPGFWRWAICLTVPAGASGRCTLEVDSWYGGDWLYHRGDARLGQLRHSIPGEPGRTALRHQAGAHRAARGQGSSSPVSYAAPQCGGFPGLRSLAPRGAGVPSGVSTKFLDIVAGAWIAQVDEKTPSSAHPPRGRRGLLPQEAAARWAYRAAHRPACARLAGHGRPSHHRVGTGRPARTG